MRCGRRINRVSESEQYRYLVGRAHPQIAWAKLRAPRDGAAIARKKLWS